MLGTNTEARLRRAACAATSPAAVIASLVGHRAPISACSAALPTCSCCYGRARGTFKDPNVLGAFLVLPGTARVSSACSPAAARRCVRGGLVLLDPDGRPAAVVLARAPGASSRSRAVAADGAHLRHQPLGQRALPHRRWSRSSAPWSRRGVRRGAAVGRPGRRAVRGARERSSRATTSATTGRFGRYLLGSRLALDHPFGIGPLQFTSLPRGPAQHLSQRLHVRRLARRRRPISTLIAGDAGRRDCASSSSPTPWQPTYHAVYVAFVGVAVESVIIDSDHWRHYFLIARRAVGADGGLAWPTAEARPSPATARRHSRPLAHELRPDLPDDDVPIQDADPARSLHRAVCIHASRPLPTGGWVAKADRESGI